MTKKTLLVTYTYPIALDFIKKNPELFDGMIVNRDVIIALGSDQSAIHRIKGITADTVDVYMIELLETRHIPNESIELLVRLKAEMNIRKIPYEVRYADEN